MYLFAIIKQQKFTVRFNTLKQNNPKKQITYKKPSTEKSLDYRWQG